MSEELILYTNKIFKIINLNSFMKNHLCCMPERLKAYMID